VNFGAERASLALRIRALTGQLAALCMSIELPPKLTALRAVAPLVYAHWYGLEL
jgi:hypothetical protein